MPSAATEPVGGFKIVYEYAKRLSIKHKITFGYMLDDPFKPKGGFKLFRKWVKYTTILRDYYTWFDFEGSEIEHILLYKNEKIISNFDIVCATAVETAYYINSLNLNKNIIHFNIINTIYNIWHLPIM